MASRFTADDGAGEVVVQVGVQGARHVAFTVFTGALAGVGQGEPGVDHAPVRVLVMAVQRVYVDQRRVHGRSSDRQTVQLLPDGSSCSYTIRIARMFAILKACTSPSGMRCASTKGVPRVRSMRMGLIRCRKLRLRLPR